MQFVQRFDFLVLLSLALFCGELSESARLVDDVSNDLVQVSAARVSNSAETNWRIYRRDGISRQACRVFEEPVRGLAVIPSTPLAISSAQDLLRLLSIQRK